MEEVKTQIVASVKKGTPTVLATRKPHHNILQCVSNDSKRYQIVLERASDGVPLDVGAEDAEQLHTELLLGPLLGVQPVEVQNWLEVVHQHRHLEIIAVHQRGQHPGEVTECHGVVANTCQ